MIDYSSSAYRCSCIEMPYLSANTSCSIVIEILKLVWRELSATGLLSGEKSAASEAVPRIINQQLKGCFVAKDQQLWGCYGPAGYALFVAVYAGLEVLAITTIPFTMSAGILFGPLTGTILVSISGTSISPEQAKRFTKFREKKGLIERDAV
ncbi:hypothetical protein Ccrd_002818 [Cynara cardunculus var. scolymus]|uniref:Uncharacterized protein n=1 Tax=Cynara cardunculus var. scolymus TaxID=59895 RepID=A0A103XQS7_CYNCS|nr:hypothetical protein Ccrd_002818 [Cynara cardunculus var. scolymus]